MPSLPLADKMNVGSSSLSKRAIFSYIFDYAIVIIFLFIFYSIDAVEPFHQQFSLRNYNIQYKYVEHQRISPRDLFIISLIAPAIIIAIYTLIIDGIFSRTSNGWRRTHSLKERLWELNCGLLGLGLSVSLTYVITGSLKNAVGKPRPDFIDRCKPIQQQDPEPFGLSNSTICTQTDHAILKDGFLSFPSGHSSISFSGLFYLSLYLAAKLHVLDSRGEVWKLFVILVPSLGAALVAGTRIMDARHHGFDVLFGCVLGILIASAAYRQYFPPISNFHAKGRAYPMRTWAREPLQPSGGDTAADYYPSVAEDVEQTQARTLPQNSSTDRLVATGNHFQDVMRHSQRQRRQASVEHGAPLDYIPPQYPTSDAVNTSANQRQLGRESLADVSPASGEYELQHQYSLNNPNRGSYDDTYVANLDAQDTTYNPNPAIPVTRLPTMRSSNGAIVSLPPIAGMDHRVQPIPGELLEGSSRRDASSTSMKAMSS